jgi:hypothetical protein
MPREWLLQPRSQHRAHGFVRQDIEAIQADLTARLKAIDVEIDRLTGRRSEVVVDLRRCRDALGGIGNKWLRRFPLPGEVDAEPEGAIPIDGADLRETIVELLRSAERPLSLSELYRALLARGRRVEGRPPHTLSNALRTAVRYGDVRRLRPGVYEAAGSGKVG